MSQKLTIFISSLLLVWRYFDVFINFKLLRFLQKSGNSIKKHHFLIDNLTNNTDSMLALVSKIFICYVNFFLRFYYNVLNLKAIVNVFSFLRLAELQVIIVDLFKSHLSYCVIIKFLWIFFANFINNQLASVVLTKRSFEDGVFVFQILHQSTFVKNFLTYNFLI